MRIEQFHAQTYLIFTENTKKLVSVILLILILNQHICRFTKKSIKYIKKNILLKTELKNKLLRNMHRFHVIRYHRRPIVFEPVFTFE